MKLLALALIYVLTAQLASGELEQVRKITKEQLAPFDQLPAGLSVTVTGEADAPVIEVANDGKPAHVELLTIQQPALTTRFHALRGEVSYAKVAGDGFLEMWSWFGDASYFSRTLGAGGPMGKLTGQSDWRGFCLPFEGSGAASPATRLVMNLTLPGKGRVTLRNLRLEQAGSFAELLGGPSVSSFGALSHASKAGLIAGLAGAVIGCLGSLLEFLAARGRARSFVIAMAWTLAGLGAVSLGAGLMSLTTHQAPGVSYGLLLAGVLCGGIFPVRLRRYLQQYRQTELRRIDSLDASGT